MGVGDGVGVRGRVDVGSGAGVGSGVGVRGRVGVRDDRYNGNTKT